MDSKIWFQKVKENQDLLTGFVAGYYPNDYFSFNEMEITAPAAENICEIIRKEIKKESIFPENPALGFEKAIKEEDFGKIYNYLNSSWFGVPESTSCWQIRGFKEAVDLLEDPPEEDCETILLPIGSQ